LRQRYGNGIGMKEHQNLETECIELDVSELERPEMREAVRLCDLILGIDDSQNEKNEVCFYGRDLLKDISKGRAAEWNHGTRMAKIHYDQRNDSLEFLCAAIRTLKGKHEYEAGGRAQ
jgi:hypothetical protein